MDQGNITAGNRVDLKLLGETQMSLVILGRHHHPRGVLVETMDDAGPEFATDAGEIVTVMEESVDQGPLTVTRRRMNDQSGRLVDDDEMRVFVKNLQRQFLGHHFRGAHGGEGDADRFSPLQLLPDLGGLAVDENLLLLDQAFQLGARQFRQLLGEKEIKARCRQAVGNKKGLGGRKMLYQIELSILPACLIITSTIARSKRRSRSGRSGETRP